MMFELTEFDRRSERILPANQRTLRRYVANAAVMRGPSDLVAVRPSLKDLLLSLRYLKKYVLPIRAPCLTSLA